MFILWNKEKEDCYDDYKNSFFQLIIYFYIFTFVLSKFGKRFLYIIKLELTNIENSMGPTVNLRSQGALA